MKVEGRDGWQSLALTVLLLAENDATGKIACCNKDQRNKAKKTAIKFLSDTSGYLDLFIQLATYKGENDGKTTFRFHGQ